MVPMLEAEGFSVWWDHTIPPGKTWDEVITAGIEQARCCIVLWSRHSVGSDWVKEEATIAKERRKFIPAQIDDSEPPVGFKRIQAANLSNWKGERTHQHWAMLVREVRNIVAASRSEGAASASQEFHPFVAEHPKPARNFVVPGLLATVVMLAIVVGWLLLKGEDRPPVSVASSAPVAETQQHPNVTPASSGSQEEEIERLRRERDAAEARVRSAQQQLSQAGAEQAERRVEQAPAPRPQAAASMVGTWRYSWGSTSGADKTFTSDGRTYDSEDGAGSWSLSGDRLTIVYDSRGLIMEGTLRGNTVTGTYRFGSGDSNPFTMTRR